MRANTSGSRNSRKASRPSLILVRHGEPDWAPGGVTVNNPGLTPYGVAQAEAVADVIHAEYQESESGKSYVLPAAATAESKPKPGKVTITKATPASTESAIHNPQISVQWRKTGEIIKCTARTIWMRLPGVERAIKRHIVKDVVE